MAPVLNVAHGPGLKNGTATLKIDGNPDLEPVFASVLECWRTFLERSRA